MGAETTEEMQTIMTCGRFQVIFMLLTQMTRFCAAWSLFIMVFGNYEPPWRCILEDGTGSQDDNTANVSQSLLHDIFFDAEYHSSDQNISSLPVSVTNNFTSLTNSSNVIYNGACKAHPNCLEVEFEPGSSTIITEFGLVCDKSWIASLIISIQMLAVVPGSYLGGQIGEHFGRKASLYSGMTILTVFLVAAIFSVNWKMHAVLIFFMSLGGGCVLATSVVFAMEFLDAWWRGIFGAVPVANIALFLLTLSGLWLRDWRMMHAMIACTSGLTLLGIVWVPESLRWLEVHGKKKKAERVVRKVCKVNGLDLPTGFDQTEVETELISSQEEKQQRAAHPTATTYLDLFRNRYMRSITVKASFAFTCDVMAYMSMTFGIKSLPGDFYLNGIIAGVAEIPLMFTIGPIANKIGRRWSVMGFLSLSTCLCAIIVVLHYVMSGHSKGFTITILVLIAKASTATAWSGLSTMSIELYPTVVRSLGYGFLNLVTGAGAVIAPYLIPQEPDWFGICFTINTALLVISLIAAMSLPETKDKPLHDVIADSDRVDGEEIC